MKRFSGILFAAVLVFTLSAAGLPSSVQAAHFTVTNINDSGPGSLRQAILNANSNPGTDNITFNIPGAGPRIIQPLSALPGITDPVIIDGYTQPGASPNTNGISLGLNTVLMIELDGSLAGSSQGLYITADNCTVRGLVINRFGGNGIFLSGNSGNHIEGCFIGTDVTGTTGPGNDASGIGLQNAMDNTIGGTMPAAHNLISGNDGEGVQLTGSANNLVQGNYIGTDVTGDSPLGNASNGVLVESSAGSNTIGGTANGAGNVIAFNGGAGVFVSSGTGNAILSNSIFSNEGLGIDLGTSGVTPNDPGDSDTGANNLQNFPVLTSVISGGGTTVEGTLNSTPDTEFRLEFFLNSTCDPSGHGEGEIFTGSTNVATDSSGNASFTVSSPLTAPDGYFITATATDPNNDTSEFSECAEVEFIAHTAIADTFISSGYPDENFDGFHMAFDSPASQFDTLNLSKFDLKDDITPVYLLLAGDHTEAGHQRALLKYDLSFIPEGATITSAVMKLFMYVYWNPGPTIPITCYRIDVPWIESEVTWNNRPPASSSVSYGSVSVGTEFGWYSWDVTSLVQEWVDNVHPNFGMMLIGPETGSQDLKGFTSREQAALEPVLVVEYEPPAPPEVTTGDATDITGSSATLNGNLDSPGDYGFVAAVGYNRDGQCEVSTWRDIQQVSAGGDHTVGLKKDGTAVAVGYNSKGQCEVGTWSGIQQVSAGGDHTVGLKKDGSVVAVGNNFEGQCEVSTWSDIQQVSAGMLHTVGLKSDGTVVAVGLNNDGQCNVSTWSDIQQVSTGNLHTVGLKSDGTVIAVGYNDYGQCEVSTWSDIQQVSAGFTHTVGLKSDGTVVAVGKNSEGQCEVSAWSDIQQVSAGSWHTVGLKTDGTVVAVEDNKYEQCNVGTWRGVQQVSAGNWYTVGLRVVFVSFEWGLDTSYGNETPPQTMDTTGPFSAPISGLDPGTTYHFRAKAVVDDIHVYGDDKSFTTGICGDVNDDGKVNMADVMILWYDIAEYPSAGAWSISSEWAADVNCDGKINMADVMILWYDIADYPSAGAWEINCCE